MLTALLVLACKSASDSGLDSDSAPDSDADTDVACVPELASIDPALGDTAGGVRVTVSGTCLDGVAVTIGGLSCTDPRSTDTRIQCLTPALPAGLHDVTAGTTLPGAFEAWSPAQIPGARYYSASADVTLDAPSGPILWWNQTGSAAPWHPRDGAGLVWLDDRLWMLGGWWPGGLAEWDGQATTNEVWSSTDLGATWVPELPDDHATTTRFGPRHTAGWLTATIDGNDYAYVIGGDIYRVTADVWRSANGVDWELMTDDAPWGGRVLQMAGTLNGDLYVMGGQVNIYDTDTVLHDVWRSTDGGSTWELLGDAPWAPRGMVYNLVELDERLWLIGGGTYDDGPRTFYNDVWSFDGTTWIEVSPDGSAPWAGREYHNTWAWNGELWVSSGYTPSGNNADVWHSADGVTWTEVPGSPMRPGHADGVTVTPYGPIHATGNALDGDSFNLIEAEGGFVTAWGDLTASPGEEPRWLAYAFLDAPGIAFDGNRSRLQTEWEGHPDGRSVFWIGRTVATEPFPNYVNPGMVVIGDSHGSCRSQAGYSDDGLELVATDALGDWSAGHFRRGSAVNDGATHLLGFTQSADGLTTAFMDGSPLGDPATLAYDAPYVGWDSVGAGFVGQNPARVVLGAVIVTPSVLADEDIRRLSEFSRKWE